MDRCLILIPLKTIFIILHIILETQTKKGKINLKWKKMPFKRIQKFWIPIAIYPHTVVIGNCPLGLNLICACFLHYWFLNLTFKSQSQKEKWSEYVRTCCCQANGNVKSISVQRILIDSKWWCKSHGEFLRLKSWWDLTFDLQMNK